MIMPDRIRLDAVIAEGWGDKPVPALFYRDYVFEYDDVISEMYERFRSSDGAALDFTEWFRQNAEAYLDERIERQNAALLGEDYELKQVLLRRFF